MMTKKILGAAATLVLLAGCTQPFKKAGEGMEYKIISDGKSQKIKSGNYFELSIITQYKGSNKDTILFNSNDKGGNQVVPLDSAQIPPPFYGIFSQVRKGDSIVIKQSTDSVLKKGGNIPPFMKKGANIFSYYKIVNIYETKEAAQKAYERLMGAARAKDSIQSIEQLKKDDKVISDYLAKNKIQAVKGAKGTYVQIINPGEGDAIDTGKVAKVLYTGKSLDDGKVFDSNTDPKFNHTEPYPVSMLRPMVIPGWVDGLALLKKGAKAIFYIPSALGYGQQGNGQEIKPNANLVFEIEVADVITEAQSLAEQKQMQAKMEADRKRMMDSVQKVQKQTEAPAPKK